MTYYIVIWTKQNKDIEIARFKNMTAAILMQTSLEGSLGEYCLRVKIVNN